MNDTLRLKITNLPTSPGCYLMKDAGGTIIYVGKAKNLKNRVSQYFHNGYHAPKVQAMVDKVEDFDIVLVDNELEALILECNLIKRHMPWYNILLKDDKQYPYIRIDMNEPFPLTELVRKPEKDNAKYFGPFMSATTVREMLDVIRTEFPMRTCTMQLAEGKAQRPCVHYEIGRCMGPCTGQVKSEDYKAVMQEVIRFLEGDSRGVIRTLTDKMKQAAAEMNYERAALYRDRINAVNTVMEKQKALIVGGADQDILCLLPSGDDMLIEALTVRGGKLIGSRTHVLERCSDEAQEKVMLEFMIQYYGEGNLPPKEIMVSVKPDEDETLTQLLTEQKGTKVTILLPQRGEKHKLLEMAMKNAKDASDKRLKALENKRQRTLGALEELQLVLGMDVLPMRIEGYDISNTQGTSSVASMVVMKGGRPSNRDYRYFKIRTVDGPNDFASMHEVITRRLSHGLREIEERKAAGQDLAGGRFSELPDVILIDGGRGQLKYAQDAMHALGLTIPMFALAERIDEIYLPGENDSIYLDRHSEALHLIQHLRDEAHRFAISHHRSLRGAAALKSRLDSIEGIGPVRKKAILKHFETMEALEQAGIKELCEVEGIAEHTAQVIYDALHGGKQE